MRIVWMVWAVGCVREPDWVAPCVEDCAKGQICTVAADERCVDPPVACAAETGDTCSAGASDACVEAICGQSATWSYECWLDDADVARFVLYCDASFL